LVLVVACAVWPARADESPSRGPDPPLETTSQRRSDAPPRPSRQQALERLGQAGLTRLGQGTVWINANELRLRRLLDALPANRDRILALQSQLEQQAAGNSQRWAALLAARRELRNEGGRLPATERRRIEGLVDSLLKQAVAPEQLGARPEIRAQVIQLINLRHETLLAVRWTRDLVPELPRPYSALEQEHEVAEALARLGPTHRLGPIGGYADQLPRLNVFERLVLTDWTPVYREAGQLRLGAILDGRLPVTFTWHEGSEPMLITANMAQALGLDALVGGAPRKLAVAPGREYELRPVRLRSLETGSCRVAGPFALVLPPEAEDLGARVGPAAFLGWVLNLQAEQLKLSFQPTP